MSAVLSEAETKFFSSRGQDVDASLKPAATTEPAANSGDAPVTAAPPPPPASNGEQPPAEPLQPQQQHVPLAALHEERKARQRAEQERQQLAQQVQQFQQQLDQLQKAQQPPPPDPNQNPFEWLVHQGQLTQQELAELKEWKASKDQESQNTAARQQFTSAITASETAFAQKHPDYHQAVVFAQQQYDKMLKALIPNDQQRQQRVIQEALGVAYTLMQEGRDPAEYFYSFAKDMGYTGPTPQPALNGGAPQPTPQPTITQVQQTIERGLKQRANPGGGGATPAGEITGEMALKLSPDEFNKWWSKQFRR